MGFLERFRSKEKQKNKPGKDRRERTKERRGLLDEVTHKLSFPVRMFLEKENEKKIHKKANVLQDDNHWHETERNWRNAGEFLPYVREIFEQENIPPELIHIVFTESEWKNESKSDKGAVGFFQLMPGTAQRLGLKVQTGVIDERLDPLKAASAAARMLSINYDQTFRWEPPLKKEEYRWGWAMLAYNQSAKRTKEQYEKHKGDLDKYIAETKNAEQAAYLAKFFAFKGVIAKRGTEIEQLPPRSFDTVTILYKERPLPKVHIVKSGENLTRIGSKYKVGRTKLIAANIQVNPRFDTELVKPGQKIIIPQTPQGEIFLSDILAYIDITEQELAKLNPHLEDRSFLDNLDPLPDGTNLYLPQGMGQLMSSTFSSTILDQETATQEIATKNLYQDLAYESLEV